MGSELYRLLCRRRRLWSSTVIGRCLHHVRYPQQRRKAHIAALMGFIFVIPVTRGRPRYAMADWSPSRRAIGAPVFYVKGEAGLSIVIRCHSGFRISRIELVHSLPPHGYKCIGSEFVH